MFKRLGSWQYIGPASIVFAAFLWSLDALLRQSLYSLPSMVIVFSEHALGFLLTLPWFIRYWPKIKKLDQKTWISILWVAVFGGLSKNLCKWHY